MRELLVKFVVGERYLVPLEAFLLGVEFNGVVWKGKNIAPAPGADYTGQRYSAGPFNRSPLMRLGTLFLIASGCRS